MRAAGGDDLAGEKAPTTLREVVGALLQSEDQFVETAAVFAWMGQTANGAAPESGLLNVFAVDVHLDRQRGQVLIE